MGVNCKIVKDNFDRIIGVLAPNGGESILFNQALNYLTGKVLPSNRSENSVSTNNIPEIFTQHSELANIGSQEEYAEYLKTIFPNSVINNVLVRGDKEKYDSYIPGLYGALGKGIYFSDTLHSGFGSNLRYVMVNVLNPMRITDEQREDIYENDNLDENFNIIDEDININTFKNKQGYDAVIPSYGNEYLLFDSSQIFTLGSEADIEGFKKYKQVSAVFEENPELAKIGTKEQYSKYIDSIFPDSEMNDIVYHGTNNVFDKFEQGHTDPRGYKTNTIGFHFIEESGIEEHRETYGKIKSVVLDMRNPISVDYDFSSNEDSDSYKLEFLNQENRKQFESEGYDSGIITRQGEKEYITFDAEQIHILGTAKDLEDFKKFNGSSQGVASQEEIEQALNVFGSAYTQEFQDFYTDEFFNTTYQTDINGEPVLEDVLTYLKSTEEHRLNEIARIDFEDFKNQFPEMDYSTLENKIYDAFLDENGNFVLDEQKLRDSGIYESQEIDNILEDSALQESIKANVLALNNEDFINTQDDNFLNIAIGEEYNSFGKLKTYDSYSLLNNILKNTVGAVTEEDFDTMLNQNVSEEVYNAIVDNKEMYDMLRTMAFNLKEIPVRTFENGSVNDVLDRDIYNELKDTLIVTNVNPEALANLYTLTQLDYDVMLENLDEVLEMANSIENALISSNIDVIGLGSKIISDDIEKVQSFLRALNTFATSVDQGYVNDEMIGAFSDVYTDFFNIENRTDLVDVESFDYDVVRLNNDISKLDAYANGYLKIQDNNYIQVANASYDDIVTSLIDSYEIGENVLEGIVPNNLKSDIAYRNYVDSIVTSKINSFGEQINPTDLDAFKSIVLLEYLNGVENNQTNNFSNYVGEKQNLENKDLDYLAFDFLSDLNNIILISKLNNNPLYEKIFQYLEFKNGEIKIKSNEEIVTSRIQNILPDNNKVLSELKDYFQPQIVEQTDYSIGKAEREYNFNNPSGLTFLNEGYTYFADQVTTDLVTPDFIRTKEGVFERIDSVDGMNIFSKLVAENGTVVVSSLNKQIKGGSTIENAVKFNNKYSQNQKGDIMDDINNCN